MKLMRHVVVIDAADLVAESSFWAGMLDGQVRADDTFHCVFDADDRWVIGGNSRPTMSRVVGRTGTLNRSTSICTLTTLPVHRPKRLRSGPSYCR